MTKKKKNCTKEMTVFIRKVDEQHQKFFKLVRNLDNNKEGMTSKEYARLLSILTDYLIEHFETEESYLRKIDYPYLNEHIADHRHFIYTISNYNLMYNRFSVPDVEEVYQFLKKWLAEHELDADMVYRNYLIKQIKND